MMIRKFLIIVLITCDLLMLVVIAHGGQVQLQWDPNPAQAVDGYRIYMRADGQLYDYSKPVWPTDGKNHFETNCTIDALISGVRYHFVARAYKGTAESGDSNEVSYIGFDPVKPICKESFYMT